MTGAPPLKPGTNDTDTAVSPDSSTDTSDGGSGTDAGNVSTVIRPIESPPTLSNHSAPSGPATMPSGFAISGFV